MMNTKILAGVSALALVLAAAAPSASLARGGIGGGGGGGGHMGGGGAHFSGGGGGMHMGGSFGAARGGSFGAAHVGGPGFSGARVAGGNWNHGGGYYRHGRFFPGVAAGIAAGAVLGSYAYYDDPYYGYSCDDPYYYNSGYCNGGYYGGPTVVVPVPGSW